MGSLLESAMQKSQVQTRGGRCAVRIIIEDLKSHDPETADDLVTALDLAHISAKALAEAIFEIDSCPVLDRLTPARVENALRRHRRGDCVCARVAGVQS